MWSLGKGFLFPGGDYPVLRLCGDIQPDVRGRSRYSRCQGHRKEGAFYSPRLHQGLRGEITVSTDYLPHGPTSINYQHTHLFLSLITITRGTTTISSFLLWPATQRVEQRGAGKPLHTRCWNVLCSPAPVPVSCESCAAFLHPEESLAGPGLHWGHGCSCMSKPNSQVSNSSQHHKKHVRKGHSPSPPPKFAFVLNMPNKNPWGFSLLAPLVLIKDMLPHLLNASHVSGASPLLPEQWLLFWSPGIGLLEGRSLRSTLSPCHSGGTGRGKNSRFYEAPLLALMRRNSCV